LKRFYPTLKKDFFRSLASTKQDRFLCYAIF
jgi:hypothetical protein